MITALIALWEFLAAFGPALLAFIAALGSAIVPLYDLVKIVAIATAIAAAIEILFDRRGRTRIANFIYNALAGGLSISEEILTEFTPALGSIVQAFANAFSMTGPSLTAPIAAAITPFAQSSFNTVVAALTATGESTAANAVANAATALSEAFSLGLSSAGVTAAFESVFPEKLNSLNGVGPMLAQLAGFSEVSANIRDPMYRAAFGRSAEYYFNGVFTPNLPTVGDAAQWLARRLITPAQYNILLVASGLKSTWATPQQAAAYRPVQPRFFTTLFADQTFPTAAVIDAMNFAGYRQSDIDLLVPALAFNATKDVRTEYLQALIRSVELGTDTAANLSSAMQQMGFSDDAQNYVQLTVAERKLQQLAELYRKSISEGYKYGTISDAQYVPSLEAIGIGSADAEAHYAVDSIAKNGKILQASARAAAELERKQSSAAMKSAIENFKTGGINAAELEAALIAANVDPTIATYAASQQVERLSGPLTYIYGQELSRNAALLLRQKVSALGKQVTAGLVTPAAALTILADNNVPPGNAESLVAGWAATKTPAADVGTLEPL